MYRTTPTARITSSAVSPVRGEGLSGTKGQRQKEMESGVWTVMSNCYITRELGAVFSLALYKL